jgi:hypothetical protein
MGKVIRLTESELKNMIKKLVMEQQGEGIFTGGGMGLGKINTTTKPVVVNMGAGLFENGVDKIDEQSAEFQKGIQALIDVSFQVTQTKVPIIVTVIGGASKVGEAQGYDNTSLAMRRANNFIKIVGQRFKNVEFKPGTPVIGDETKKGPKADMQQFVRLVINKTKTETTQMPNIDHTTNKLNISPNDRITGSDPNRTIRICYDLPEKYYILLAQFKRFEVKREKTSGFFGF